MRVNCDLLDTILTVLWLVIGVATAGPIGFALGRRGLPKGAWWK